uniref:Glycosyltransferase 61 catalytic domain-containing protein n=1 Tax=Chromera velia CCMP2878 TaxID=1169474 RepID=A0A0G4FMW6_9ALVE|eukprot:Cvel_17656.t1-p1 / transcript=Cvel_17656.t1 / gene=Cvel_17656 / organism=Chromera_velia_CCMP2878 / gene_product=hypothetical protein / transcript_product=hypothetical protein / location=Cvel_scaffold1422:13376-14982(+) / protein_length=495 / sequence_SO=supercontig / SO=protein_coding / is_pseudo=false
MTKFVLFLGALSLLSRGDVTEKDGSVCLDSASGECSPAAQKKRNIADCRPDHDSLDTCEYETLCYDGEQYFIVASDREEDLEAATADYQPTDRPFSMQDKRSSVMAYRYHHNSNGKRPSTPLNYLDKYDFVSWEKMLEKGPIEWLPDGTKFLNTEQNPSPSHFITHLMMTWSDQLDRPEGSVYFLNTELKCMTSWKDMFLDVLLTRGKGLFTEAELEAWLAGMSERDPNLPTPARPALFRDHLWPTQDLPTEGKPFNHCNRHIWQYKESYTVCARNARTYAFRQHMIGGWRDHASLRESFGISERSWQERSESPRVLIVDRLDVARRHFRDPEGVRETLEQLPAYLNVSVQYIPGWPEDGREQVALMADTDVLVTPHGSGLTNAMFLSQNAAVVEIYNFGFIQDDLYRDMLERQGVYYRAMIGFYSEEREKELLEGDDDQRKCAEMGRREDYKRRKTDNPGHCFYPAWKLAPVEIDLEELKKTVSECIFALGNHL